VGSPQAEIVGWVLFPLAFAITCLGVGWLVASLLRLRVRGPLVIPIGLSASIVALMPGYALGADDRFAVPLLVVLTVAGFVTRRRDLRPALSDALAGPWSIAAVVVVVAYMAPALLSGGWTWTGYNFVNDTAVQFLLTDWLAGHGVSFHGTAHNTTLAVTNQYLQTHYPLGVHAHLATFQGLLGTPVAVLYQTYLGLLMAVTSLACYQLASRAGLGAWVAAVAAVLAPLAALTYQYGLQGNVKELATIAIVVTAAAVARELVEGRDTRGWALCLAVCLAALLEVFAAAGVPYVLALSGAAIAAALLAGPKPLRKRLFGLAVIAGIGVLALALPALVSIGTSLRTLNAGFASSAGAPPLGQLARQLPLAQAGGIWLAGDYRVPIVDSRTHAATTVGLVVVGLLLIAGIVWVIRRRESGPLILLGALVVTYVILAPRTTPYADGKMLAILSPGIVLVAVIGAWALWERVRVAGVAALGIVGVLVLASSAIAFHDTKLAPTDRMRDMADIGDRFSGRGLMLFNEYEEFAKYFMRDADINASTEAATPVAIQLRGGDGYQFQTYDLDEQKLPFVEEFGYIVLRRGPATSRPPANFRFVYENDSYAVWQRVAGATVLDHLSLASPAGSAGIPSCADVQRFARAAAPDEVLVAASAPASGTWNVVDSRTRPFSWPPDPERPGQAFMGSPGIASGTLTLPSAGRYVAWVKGTFGRPLKVRVDGRPMGQVEGTNTPGGWLAAGSRQLTAGRHAIEIRRDGGDLAPGDGSRSSVGPVTLLESGNGSLVRVAPAHADRLCGTPWDWIERVSETRSAP
jgi:hypothetical protein